MKETPTSDSRIPKEWHAQAHKYWLNGKRQEAIQATINYINTLGSEKPAPLLLQLSYYFFLLKDYQSAAKILEQQFAKMPDHLETVLNLAVCYLRLQKYNEAVKCANNVLELNPENVVALDVLTKSNYALGHKMEAIKTGTQALIIKDRNSDNLVTGWNLPAENRSAYALQHGKHNVISFSLWGNLPQYLRGAIQNIMLAQTFFPQWNLRFNVDDSVPTEFIEIITKLGTEVIMHSGFHTEKQKLCWRFQVANDPAVGYFMVRDVDSVFGVREAQAVREWLESDSWFHVIRDWWTHTDLILAGMWGGVADILPSLSDMLSKYSPGRAETPNIDQWFLGEQVWPFVRQSCIIHDRFFRTANSIPLPGPEPVGNYHIGQNEFVTRPKEQEKFLRPLIARYPTLGKILAIE